MTDLKERLKHANTLNQVIAEVNKDYNLDKELGPITKMVVINGVDLLLKKIKAEKRIKLKL